MRRKLNIRVTERGPHLLCNKCGAHYPNQGEHQAEAYRIFAADRSIHRAMLENRAVQAMAAAIRASEMTDAGR